MELEKFPAMSELWESFSLQLSGNCSFPGSCSLTLWSFTLEAHKFLFSQKLKRDCLKSSGTPSLCSFLLCGITPQLLFISVCPNSRLCLLNSVALLGSVLIFLPCTTGMLLLGSVGLSLFSQGLLSCATYCLMSEISCFMYFVLLVVYGIRVSPRAVTPLWIEAEVSLFIFCFGFEIISSWASHLICINDHPSFQFSCWILELENRD